MKPNDENLTLEERRKRFFEKLDRGEFTVPAKPRVPVVSVPVAPRVAQAAKANPESVRVIAREEDGVSVFSGPQGNPLNVKVMVEYVREVDADGRPVWPSAEVETDYDPMSRL
jgi:hypothetical protein